MISDIKVNQKVNWKSKSKMKSHKPEIFKKIMEMDGITHEII